MKIICQNHPVELSNNFKETVNAGFHMELNELKGHWNSEPLKC